VPDADALAKHHFELCCHLVNNCGEMDAIAEDSIDERLEMYHIFVDMLSAPTRNTQQCNASTKSCRMLKPGCNHVALKNCNNCSCPLLLKYARFWRK